MTALPTTQPVSPRDRRRARREVGRAFPGRARWPAARTPSGVGRLRGRTGWRPTVVLRSPQALRRLLWHPGELGLAQAYVTGDIDIDGDLAEGFRRVHVTAPDPARSA